MRICYAGLDSDFLRELGDLVVGCFETVDISFKHLNSFFGPSTVSILCNGEPRILSHESIEVLFYPAFAILKTNFSLDGEVDFCAI